MFDFSEGWIPNTPHEINTKDLEELVGFCETLPEAGSDLYTYTIMLYNDQWIQETSVIDDEGEELKVFSQEIHIDLFTEKTLVELNPDAQILKNLGSWGVVGLYTRNNTGIVSVVSMGSAPKKDFAIQISFTEIEDYQEEEG